MITDFQFDKKWTLQPIKGETGQTYLGVSGDEKVFIKRNSSPFLAALSREGIAPKLIWTKRTGNGDILTAQEWLEGSLLSPDIVGNSREVITIMKHLHQSDSLKSMLKKVGGEEQTALDFLSAYVDDLPTALRTNQYLESVFRYLENYLPEPVEPRACHGDPLHHNWLLSEEGRLYLVDWDSSMLADPASDLGTILGRYVAHHNWHHWLLVYGIEPNKDDMDRIYWYCGINFLLRIKQAYLNENFKLMNHEIALLKEIYIY
ncbi:phosphotransferase family protein [Vagococcus proximus]|uniref:phosphotransferase family protein n=1 Tax=Vagococcus proximus TaxID=2991417 RepID=UPI00266D80DD|nr:phosphotransferase family protein [Vagococcus proximus]